MLSVDGLNFSYGNKQILHDVSFKVENNSIVSILGPNGVGKTTLLKCLCNIHRPQTGTIAVDDEDILSIPQRSLAQHIAYVPQKTQAVRSTVFDYVLIGRRPHIELSASKKDMDMAWNAIHAMDLDHLAVKYMDSISGGEFQKVQIARAMVQDPKVLILDEPTSNLDISNAHRTMHMIFDIVKKQDLCTVMTMHDLNLAIHFSDKFIFIKNGVITAYGGYELITPEVIDDVFGIDVEVIYSHNKPYVIPAWEQPNLIQYENFKKTPHELSAHVHD